MTVVTINGTAWAVGVTWICPSHGHDPRRFPVPPPRGAAAWVESAGQGGFVTATGAGDAGAVSLGAALRTRLPRPESWVALALTDDGRTALLSHLVPPFLFSPVAVCASGDEARRLLPFCAAAGTTIHAAPPLAEDAMTALDLDSLPRTEEMRLAVPAAPWFRTMAAKVLSATFAVILVLLPAAPAEAQELLPLPPVESVVTVIEDTAPPAAAAEQALQEPVAPDLDEATAALVTMLTATDTGEGPPMAGCAIDLLRTRLAAAVAPDDILAATALEDELLRLCLARQKLVGEVLAADLQLAALGMIESETEASSLVVDAPPQVIPEPPPLPTLDQLTLPQVLQEPAGEVEEAVEADPAPPYVWSTMLGTAGNMRAAVTDGSHVWWVREGDILPGGWQVIRIATQPPGVSLRHSETGDWALAHGGGG